MIRLDKCLTEMGIGSRADVKKLIRKGLVEVDGVKAKKPEEKIDETKQEIRVEGALLTYAKFEYYMLNKPQGVISATEDAKDTTVVDLIHSKKRKDLFPVGRLDKDTEGLLLITNDGALAHRLLSPKHHVDKTYYAKVEGFVKEELVSLFSEGINIGTHEEEEWTMPARLEIIDSGEISTVRLTIQEGKFHQVKRMFQAFDHKVIYLKRESMGSLVLDETLLPGQFRPLSDEELEGLQQ